MTIENVKLHTAHSVADAQAVMKILESADVQFELVAANDNAAIRDRVQVTKFQPIDLYIHRDDLARADMALRPLFVG